MRTTLRTSIAVISAVAVLAISAIAAATNGPAPLPVPAKEDGGGAAGACAVGVPDCNDTGGTPMPGTAMCVQGVPDCNDMNLGGGGQSEPGSAGGGEPVAVPPTDGTGGTDPACGQTVTGDGPDGTVSYTPCDSPQPPVPTEPTITKPTPGMAEVHARPFDSATIGDDDRTVTIDFVSGVEPCSVLDHIDVVESDGSVTITLYEGSDPSAGSVACIDIGVYKRAVITLDHPLAGRTLEDGAA